MHEAVIPIEDTDIYVERMNKAVLDKLFWADKLFDGVDTIVDVGCGSGVVLAAYKRMFPASTEKLVCIDNNPDMLERARQSLSDIPGSEDVEYYSSLAECPTDCENGLILLSSVLHEVFSYGDYPTFIESVFARNPKYVAIRDMCTPNVHSLSAANPIDIQKIRLRSPELLEEFEKLWGPLWSQESLVHFLLKYRYKENWDRELRENYLLGAYSRIMCSIPSAYNIVYNENYTLPYAQYTAKRDYDIKLIYPTHLKLIVKRKEG